MPRRRFRFTSSQPHPTLSGAGWHAQFVGGVFETDDQRTAEGIAREALRQPELGIGIERGKRAVETAPTPPPPAEASGA